MKVINIDTVPEYCFGEKETNTLRKVKDVFESRNMKIDQAIIPPKTQTSKHVHER